MVAAAAHPVPSPPCRSFAVSDEIASDAPARERLLDLAMGPGRRRKVSEKIRRGRTPADDLSLVARNDDGDLVGTVRLWDIIAGEDQCGHPVPALLLGPLAVDEWAQGRGVGSALMEEAISRARKRGPGAILLVGNPDLYRRFGFSAGRTGSLFMPGPFERCRLLALETVEGWLDGASGMIAPSGRIAPRRRHAA